MKRRFFPARSAARLCAAVLVAPVIHQVLLLFGCCAVFIATVELASGRDAAALNSLELAMGPLAVRLAVGLSER